MHVPGILDDLCISTEDYDALFDHTVGPDCIVGTEDDGMHPGD